MSPPFLTLELDADERALDGKRKIRLTLNVENLKLGCHCVIFILIIYIFIIYLCYLQLSNEMFYLKYPNI